MKGSLVLLSALAVSGVMAQPFANTFARSSVVANVAVSEAQPLPNGNFAVAVRSFANQSYLYILRPSGTVLAGRLLSGFPGQTIRVKTLSATPTGEIYTFSEAPESAMSRQIYVHKFDAAGTLLWRRPYNPGAGALESVADSVCDPADNLLFVGDSRPGQFDPPTSWIMRIKPTGVISISGVLTASTAGTTIAVSSNGVINALAQGTDRSYLFNVNNLSGNATLLDELDPGSEFVSLAMRNGITYLAGKAVPSGNRAVPTVISTSSTSSTWNWTHHLPVGPTATEGSYSSILLDGSGTPIAAGNVFDSYGFGVVAKINKDTSAAVWTRSFGGTSNDRVVVGLGLDIHNEAYVSMQSINPDGQRIHVQKIGPTGSLRGGVIFPAGINPTESPQTFALNPRMGNFFSAGTFGSGASRWVGWSQQSLLVNSNIVILSGSTRSGNAFTNCRYVGDVPAVVVNGPFNGTLTFNGATGDYSYKHTNLMEYEDEFTFRIQKPGLPPVQATVHVDIL